MLELKAIYSVLMKILSYWNAASDANANAKISKWTWRNQCISTRKSCNENNSNLYAS